jgi:hypothetical protein
MFQSADPADLRGGAGGTGSGCRVEILWWDLYAARRAGLSCSGGSRSSSAPVWYVYSSTFDLRGDIRIDRWYFRTTEAYCRTLAA